MGRGSESASGASSSSSGSESSREEGQDAMMLRKGVQRDQEQREDDIDDACPSDSPSASSSDTPSGAVITTPIRYASVAGALASRRSTGVVPPACTWYTVRVGNAKLDPLSRMIRMNVISIS